MTENPTLAVLRHQLEETERDLRLAQTRAREAEQRALLAEKSAREAWTFARTVLHRPPGSPTTE